MPPDESRRNYCMQPDSPLARLLSIKHRGAGDAWRKTSYFYIIAFSGRMKRCCEERLVMVSFILIRTSNCEVRCLMMQA